MAAWLQALIVLAGGGVVVALAGLAHKWTKQSGEDAARADRAQADLEVKTRQGEIIAEQRTVEHAAKRLDSGDF